jgi:hypothetical protein
VTAKSGPPRAVHFDIGRVTLDGYSPGQRARFVSSLRTRLAGLAASDGDRWPTAAQRRIGHLDAGVLQAGAAPEQAAERIAAALFAALADGPADRRTGGESAMNRGERDE